MSKTNKLHFIEAMLNWFASPSMGRELDVKFLSDAYDEITTPAWVSVEERVPPKMGKYSKCSNEVLVITERKERFIAKYWYDGTGWVVSGFSTSKLTHWMPLPTPPAEKGGER